MSRLVVDPERFPDEREEMLAVGMGAVYTRTTHRAELRPAWHRPGTAGRAVLPAVREGHDGSRGRPARRHRPGRDHRRALLSGSPLPYELHGEGARPPVCLGTDAFHTPPELLAAAREAFAPGGRRGWTVRSAERTYRWTSTAASPGSAP
ncbi:hypothetical protein WKI71_38785 [Streptomyces sp. MS1.AVA.1]|uniref:Uncharacterized protein n=1 Tax=Streptomyces machairae TaxID=3134109 RepID=A0ABU8UVA7_9ACTN